MGQSTSRASPLTDTANSNANSNTTSASASSSSSGPQVDTIASNGRRSVRRSILSLVKPSSGRSRARQRAGSARTSTAGTETTPESTTLGGDDSPTAITTPQDEITAESAGEALLTAAPPQSSTSSTSSSPLITSIPLPQPDLSNNLPLTTNPIITTSPPTPPAPTATPLPDTQPDLVPPIQPTTTNTGSGTAPAPVPTAQPRQFPPPGTLVVVQGIVHTTDRPPSYPSSSSSSGAGAAAGAGAVTEHDRQRRRRSWHPSTTRHARPRPLSSSNIPTSSSSHAHVPSLLSTPMPLGTGTDASSSLNGNAPGNNSRWSESDVGSGGGLNASNASTASSSAANRTAAVGHRSSTRSFNRNRLSALLRPRPASMASNTSSGAAADDSDNNNDERRETSVTAIGGRDHASEENMPVSAALSLPLRDEATTTTLEDAQATTNTETDTTETDTVILVDPHHETQKPEEQEQNTTTTTSASSPQLTTTENKHLSSCTTTTPAAASSSSSSDPSYPPTSSGPTSTSSSTSTSTLIQNPAPAPAPAPTTSSSSSSHIHTRRPLPPIPASSASPFARGGGANAHTTTTPNAPPTSAPAPNPHAPLPPSISSNSIDVLGTLLSVAAAATAASLLTGSSEPILSSGLAHPLAGATGTGAANSNPTPPNPTPPLSNRSSRNRLSTPTPPNTDRMHQVWGGIRQRLGLRGQHATPPPPPEEAPPPLPSMYDTQPTTEPAFEPSSPTPIGATIPLTSPRTRLIQDTRELMLQEMTRAFNVGLELPSSGSNSSAADSNTPGEGDEQEEPVQPLPAEGSFERFLLDLQYDLRSALRTEGEDEDDDDDEGEDEDEEDEEGEDAARSEHVDDERLPPLEPIGSDEDMPDRERLSLTPPPGPVRSNSATQTSQDYHDMPALADSDGSDSDSDSEFDPSNAPPQPPPAAAPAVSQTPPNNNRFGPNSNGSGMSRIDASGRISWWRVYRFPPISSPRLASVGTATAPAGAQSEPTPPSADAPSSTTTASAAPAPPPRAAETHNHTVVPVIVVGLQSVNPGWATPAEFANVGADPFAGGGSAQPTPPGTEPTDEDFVDAFANQNHQGHAHAQTHQHGPTQPSGRTWPSRAANAIRNLRPGRRHAHEVQQPNHGQSRTFLIYVIGGYYPPDHTIVTGGPSNFDSFETFLELAEILGSMRPPTATKEDIDRSGLEIIKPAQLEQYEKAGKIASNCTERCLICLDDYAEEDDIRLLTCRHAFHKTCVDTWLHTGRNNCPACRSTGVADSRASREQTAT